MECSITEEWLSDKLSTGVCDVTGIKFDMLPPVKSRMRAFAPSVDRIDSSLGYNESNCQVVCWLYNRAKGDGTHADVMKLAEALVALDRKTTPTV